jgi:RNA polymerase sigma-70 factor, ECF subfamily
VTPDEERQAADLMRQAQAGVTEAYVELLIILTAVARRYARGRVGAVPWVDDIVQETLLTVHLARHSYDSARPFAPWFYAIVKSRLIDGLRRERRIASRETQDPAAAERSSGDPDRGGLDADAVRRALQALPPRQRDIIESMKYRDQSVREIAHRLGLSESAVKVTAHRGYRVLRKLLGGK